MLRRWRTELIALVVGIAIGVGAGVLLGLGPFDRTPSEPDRARDAATAYLQAFADDDPGALCAHISPLGRARLQFNARSCEQSAQTAITQLPQAQRDALRDAKVTAVAISGTRGTAHFTPKLSGRNDMQLVKVGEQWLVNE